MFEKPMSIKELLPKINKEYFLPAIQREFVWREEQIISLFDSMLKEYPIGSFLFWKIKQPTIMNYDFYKFSSNQTNNSINNFLLSKEEKSKLNEVISILDGQQRITALMIALNGDFNGKELYVSLTNKYSTYERDEIDLEYKFQFRKENELNTGEHWFKVKNILNMDFKSVAKYSVENENIDNLGLDILNDLYDLISSKVISYHLEETEDIQRVLTIFVRVNSGGTHLSYADLLLSMATSNWNSINAREEINTLVEVINNMGKGFKVTKDFVLKTSLYMLDREIKFKISNYQDGGMKGIEENWFNIKDSLIKTFEFLSNNNFYHKNLNSNYAASVIAFYIHNIGNIKDDQDNVIKFIRHSLLRGIYSSSLDTTLKSLRSQLKKYENFNIHYFNEVLQDNKQLIFTEREIKNFTSTKYTQNNFWLLLTIIFEKEPIEIEEILDSSSFDKDDQSYKMLFNYTIKNNALEIYDLTKRNNSNYVKNKYEEILLEKLL